MSRGLLNLSGEFLGIPERAEGGLEGLREGDSMRASGCGGPGEQRQVRGPPGEAQPPP